jgi:hypothetical protein
VLLLITLRLQLFVGTTKKISKSKTPLVHEVIPIFDVLTRTLDKHVADVTLPPAIRVAAARGRTMLNKYYSLTDDSIVYRIAMSKSSHVYMIMTLTHTFQCCIPVIRCHISAKRDGVMIGLPMLKPFCATSGI